MIKNKTVSIYNNIPIPDGYGGQLSNPTYIKDIDIDIQPYNSALLLKNYGYNIEVNKRIYIDYFDSDIKIGTILKYKDKYGVDTSVEIKAIPWDDGYMEVMGLVIY